MTNSSFKLDRSVKRQMALMYDKSKSNQYKKLMDSEENVIFGGRLADYKYYDMHQVIGSALKRVKDEIG